MYKGEGVSGSAFRTEVLYLSSRTVGRGGRRRSQADFARKLLIPSLGDFCGPAGQWFEIKFLKNMKRILSMLAIAATVVFLSGCKGDKGPSIAAPSFNANFDMNAVQDIKEGVDGVINITALGKVSELTVTLTYPDETYQKLVAQLIGIPANQPVKGQKSGTFDLINDATAIRSLAATTRAHGANSCTMNLMKAVEHLVATGASNNDQFKFAIKCVDQEGQTSSKTVTYKWTAVPTFTWVEQKATPVEYKEASKGTANFKVFAPAGIKVFKVKVTSNVTSFSNWLNSNIKITGNQSNTAPVLDLIEDSYAKNYIGSSVNDLAGKKTEVKLDLSKILSDFVVRGAETGSEVTMNFTIGDEFGRTIESQTVSYKYTGEPEK